MYMYLVAYIEYMYMYVYIHRYMSGTTCTTDTYTRNTHDT